MESEYSIPLSEWNIRPGAGLRARIAPLQGTQRDACRSATADGPAHDAPREQIHHGAKIAPLLAHTQICDVADPNLIQLGRGGLIEPEIGGFLEEFEYPGLAATEHACFSAQAQLCHPSGNPLGTATNTLASELLMHSRAAVDAPILLIYDHCLEGLVPLLTNATFAPLPGVKPAT